MKIQTGHQLKDLQSGVGKMLELDGNMKMEISFHQPYRNQQMQRKGKKALSELGDAYQYDITKLNTSWLAAAVSDGINETAKKDAVIAQINERKEKYSQDRAAIIAQYPED